MIASVASEQSAQMMHEASASVLTCQKPFCPGPLPFRTCRLRRLGRDRNTTTKLTRAQSALRNGASSASTGENARIKAVRPSLDIIGRGRSADSPPGELFAAGLGKVKGKGAVLASVAEPTGTVPDGPNPSGKS
jgi:hypothetical protein